MKPFIRNRLTVIIGRYYCAETGDIMEDREKLIKQKIQAEEEIEMMQLQGVKQQVWEILTTEKHFDPQEIVIDPEFILKMSSCEAAVGIDFIINLPEASLIVIKCSPTAIESWERYTISFARVVKDYQIPYAMVTDGEKARIFDVITGSLIGENIHKLFNRQEAIEIMKDFKKLPCPSRRLEKEKRIAYAFEGIKCPSSKEQRE